MILSYRPFQWLACRARVRDPRIARAPDQRLLFRRAGTSTLSRSRASILARLRVRERPRRRNGSMSGNSDNALPPSKRARHRAAPCRHPGQGGAPSELGRRSTKRSGAPRTQSTEHSSFVKEPAELAGDLGQRGASERSPSDQHDVVFLSGSIGEASPGLPEKPAGAIAGDGCSQLSSGHESDAARSLPRSHVHYHPPRRKSPALMKHARELGRAPEPRPRAARGPSPVGWRECCGRHGSSSCVGSRASSYAAACWVGRSASFRPR